MAPRALPETKPVTLQLVGNVKFLTSIDAGGVHHATCDICGSDIKLTTTANPYRLQSHRTACLKLAEKKQLKTLHPLNTLEVPISSSSQPRLGLDIPDNEAGETTPTRSSTPILPEPSTPTNPRQNRRPGPGPARPGRHVRTESLVQITDFMASLNTDSPVLPDLLSGPPSCPGLEIPWMAGSMWGTYPYGLHEAKDVGWEPICFNSQQNNCLAREGDANGTTCANCQRLPRTAAFFKVQARAIEVKEHTPWQYLTATQQRALVSKLTKTCNDLRTELSNRSRANVRLRRQNTDYRRIMMLLSQNEIPGLRRLLTGLIKRGASPQMVLALLERAIQGLYRARGGFNKRELDISFLVKAMGGPKLLYALQKSHGLASVSTVHRSQPILHLLPSIGVPSRAEIDHNIGSFFDPEIKPVKLYPECNGLPGNILMFDGIAIETKCRYCPRRNAILGLCGEHASRVNIHVDSLESVEKVRLALAETDSKSKTKVCFGSDATVVAIAPYADEDQCTAVPIVVSPSDKKETGEGLEKWLRTVLKAWKEHPQGEALHGPIWAIGSDGDSVYRLAKFLLCMVKKIEPDSDLGKILMPLLGLNLYTSVTGIVLTSDMKHITKRFATLMRSTQGLVINDTLIRAPDIVDNLSILETLSKEKAAGLLDPGDKQNVPKAILLIQELSNLKNLSMPLNPIQSPHEPFRTDSQAVVKNIIITIARMQLLNPNLKFYILLEGTDRLEVVFGDTRTLDHARNFDIEQLGQKLRLGTLINAALQRNPDLDRGHRRLKLDGALGIDHANPKSWIGDVRVGNVNLLICWNLGQEAANKILVKFFGPDACINFTQIFSEDKRDLLRPDGEYVGTSFCEDDQRSEMDNENFPTPDIPVMPMATAVAANTIIPDPDDSDNDENDETELGLDFDDFLPNTLEELDQEQEPLIFSKSLVAEDGKEYMKSSIVATLSSNRSRKATTRTLRV
ncbi:hypothetical protein DFH08DRAFT_799463 [Mycena albidolilacea]|uniref:Uncharacterized protein n=1 Tax=Mycena albidolilacea TaxID=1033008 RepID=A0AAD7F2G2_9AGAR|nr:hypothetical protein DFH08DRAFT_799463 [Mycena albidolilacea]